MLNSVQAQKDRLRRVQRLVEQQLLDARFLPLSELVSAENK